MLHGRGECQHCDRLAAMQDEKALGQRFPPKLGMQPADKHTYM
jgi:hypothetical protein